MLGYSYEVDIVSTPLSIDEIRSWLDEFLPPERWKLMKHPYEDRCVLLWFRFEADALMFGFAHDRRPKSGALVYLSMLSRLASICVLAGMMLWLYLWSRIGYHIARLFRSKDHLVYEPEFDEFVEDLVHVRFPFLRGFGQWFEDWHRTATGGGEL
jgi:hypothetical protein